MELRVGDFIRPDMQLAKATAYGWGADHHNWYGKAMSVLGQAVSSVYARRSNEVSGPVRGTDSPVQHCGYRRQATRDCVREDMSPKLEPPQSPYTKSRGLKLGDPRLLRSIF